MCIDILFLWTERCMTPPSKPGSRIDTPAARGRRHKSFSDFDCRRDVGLVALPLAMAFCHRFGSPRTGRYCAIVTGFLISALRRIDTHDWRTQPALLSLVGRHCRQQGSTGLFMLTMMARLSSGAARVTGMAPW